MKLKRRFIQYLMKKSEMLLGDYDEKQVLEEINVNLEEEYDKSDVYCP